MNERPLSEVIALIAKMRPQLRHYDGRITDQLRNIQAQLLRLAPQRHPIDVPFPPWGRLGWSGRRNRWRLVVVDDDGCDDLLAMPIACRIDACHVLPRLVERLGINVSISPQINKDTP